MVAQSVTVELRFDGIYLKVARDLHRMGVYLQCKQCRTRSSLTPTGIAGYLRYGWPECCGETMPLFTDEPTTQHTAYQGA